MNTPIMNAGRRQINRQFSRRACLRSLTCTTPLNSISAGVVGGFAVVVRLVCGTNTSAPGVEMISSGSGMKSSESLIVMSPVVPAG